MRLTVVLPMVALSFFLVQPNLFAASDLLAASNVAAVQTESYATNPDGENALQTGDYPRAQTVFSAALSAGKNDTNMEGYLRAGLGEALMWQGLLNEAGKEFSKATSLLKNADPKMRARLLDDLAYFNQTQGKMDKALDNTADALAIRQANLTADPAIYVSTAIHMVNLLDRTGQLDKAQKIATEALKIQQDKFGADTIMAANLNDQLGLIYRKLGKQDLANQCFNASLQVKLSRNAVTAQYSPHPYWEAVTFRFLEGAPNCVRKFANGDQYEIVTANGVTVAACIASKNQNFAKFTQLNIRVRNETNQPVQFLGQKPELVSMFPKIVWAHQIDPGKLAETVEKSGNKKAKWVRFWGENATQTMTSTMIGNGGGYWGYQPMYGGGYNNYGRNSGNMSFMTTQVPDYAAQQRALQKAADITESSQQTADAIRNNSLGATTLIPGQSLQGSLYYDQPQLKKAILDLPVGNATFEFEFPPR